MVGTIHREAWRTLLMGAVAFCWACVHDGGPNGPACDNAGAVPCSDCDAANPAHPACYDAFTREALPVFKRYCLGCHGTGGIGEFLTGGDSGVNFEPDLAYGRLLRPSFGDKGATMRIVPGHPEASALYNKITAGSNGVWFGSPMPQGKALSETDPEAVEIIRKWIANGAKPPAASGPR
jgi:hypothetical protein